jgi:hypothetical protein
MQKFLLIAIGVIMVAGCRSTRKITTAIGKKETVDSSANAKADSVRFIKEFTAQFRRNHIEYTTFSSKVDIDYKDNTNKSYDVNAVLRMYKDSVIWISANAILGIEAIRVMITKDSVKILDKLNKTYTERSLDYLQDATSLPLDIHILQDMIIGNAIYLDTNIVSYSKGVNSVTLLSIGELFKNLISISEQEHYLQRSKLDDKDITHNRTADLVYTDYETKKGKPFSTKRKITISEAKKLDIKLDFKQYDFNGEVSFPFSIPKNFTRN